jgi:hypothetical protein
MQPPWLGYGIILALPVQQIEQGHDFIKSSFFL